ncbi:hypothetical protein CUT44_22430 [Streptomyces carminius]|uniref:Lipoprotein n=1 Tax=Streptomyces carminius TaxID=2665496 RepID=A0A2M8LU94_9ACTN|nr:hypothetical protein [Streptomyces carminius]PJE95528.1 hypothetical protein CUT44_22430 [Streptomyces carminius]
MRTSARCAGAAAVLAAALLAGGCSGGGDSGSGEPERSPTARESTGPTADGGEPTADSGGVNGNWTTTSGSDALVLSVGDGQAALLGRSTCTGPVDTGADPVTFTLTCADGDEERTRGTVESADGRKLEIAWESGTTDTFTRVEIPTELPTGTGDLPSTLPSDLGELGGLPTE